METFFSEQISVYDGRQLSPLFAYRTFGVEGHSIVSWVGPCAIPDEHIVDIEDLRAKARIEGSMMLHFIVEVFGANLREMVALQRLFASIAVEQLKSLGQNVEGQTRFPIRREGDDLFVQLRDREGKLSISIASLSSVSGMIHFAVNVTNDGTPVPTASLEDLRISAKEYSERLSQAFASEFQSIVRATQKVKPLT